MYQLKIECIGDDIPIGISKRRYWVCEIFDFDEKYVFKRKFIDGNKDYSNSNSVGSRGVYMYYNLYNENLYEIQYPVSWKKNKRFFAIIKNDELYKIKKEELIKCLIERI